MRSALPSEPAVGVVGGSGLYDLEGFRESREIRVSTPFGSPSDLIVGGTLEGRPVYFLPRHGRGHRLLPAEINHRANIWALRSLGVRWIYSVTAVGSLQEPLRPRDLVLPDQFFDRTSRRSEHSFFGNGIVAHVAFAEPVSAGLSRLAAAAARESGLTCHEGGVYVNMDGPAFSTRAESEFHRRMGFDVVGMTNVAEAKLSREAEIAFASLAFVTDYDAWREGEEAVTAGMVFEHLRANVSAAREMLRLLLPRTPSEPDWPEHRALDAALVTDRALWPEETVQRLWPLLERFAAARNHAGEERASPPD
ncbi:MAG TPA: S-methyl-5'-thioadenosine phosphorylase [Verrucomicrobiales bacterium]|nr:S-methyl-5'-thioadenosine phosphorylase [Verrucomicrobiales bacterium]